MSFDQKQFMMIQAKEANEEYRLFEAYHHNKPVGSVRDVFETGHAAGAAWAKKFLEEVLPTLPTASAAVSEKDK